MNDDDRTRSTSSTNSTPGVEPVAPTDPATTAPVPAEAPPARPERSSRAAELRRTADMSAWGAIVGIALITLLAAVFVLQNVETVDVEFITLRAELPLAVAMLFSFVAGVLLMLCVSALRAFRRSRRH